MADGNSVNYTEILANHKVKGELNIKKRCLTDSYVTVALTNNDDDEILLPSIPEGAKILDAYVIVKSAFGASGTVNLGLKAHVDKDGNAVAEDEDSLVAAVGAVGAAAIGRADEASAALGTIIGKGGAQVFLKNAAAITNAAVTIEVVVEYGIE